MIICDNISGIYKITSPSGKIYIGQSVDIKARWYTYSRVGMRQSKIYNSIVKYGIENHIFEVIEECEVKDLTEREVYWQKYYNSVEKGLNCKYASEIYSVIKNRALLIGNAPENTNYILDTETGVFYYGFSDAKRHHNYGKRVLVSMLRGLIHNNSSLVLSDTYEKDKETKEVNEAPRYNRVYKCYDEYIVMNFDTKEEIGSVSRASKILKISYGKLRNYLTGVSYNPTNLIYKSNFQKGLTPRDIGVDNFANSIKVINTETKEVYESIKQAADKFSVSPKTIATYINFKDKSKLPIMKLSEYNNIN